MELILLVIRLKVYPHTYEEEEPGAATREDQDNIALGHTIDCMLDSARRVLIGMRGSGACVQTIRAPDTLPETIMFTTYRHLLFWSPYVIALEMETSASRGVALTMRRLGQSFLSASSAVGSRRSQVQSPTIQPTHPSQ